MAPNEAVYGGIMSALERAKKVDQARTLFDEMRNEGGLPPNVILCNTLLGGYSRLGRWQDAQALLLEMDTQFNVQPDTISYR